jgi:hypothetical protein
VVLAHLDPASASPLRLAAGVLLLLVVPALPLVRWMEYQKPLPTDLKPRGSLETELVVERVVVPAVELEHSLQLNGHV